MIDNDVGSVIELDLGAAAEYLADRPYVRLQAFADLLGWHGLRPYVFRIVLKERNEEIIQIGYWSGDQDFQLRLSECRQHTSSYSASVNAERHGVAHSGVHSFELYVDDPRLVGEAERLRPYLFRDNYLDPAWCANFAREYPELRNTGIALNNG